MTAAKPRISPLEAYLFLIFFDWGFFEGRGLIRGGGGIIIVEIKKTLSKYLVYFSMNFFMVAWALSGVVLSK